MAEVDFETVVSEEVKFGTNNFLEIARKKAITSDSENEFISISRGFFTPENDEKRFRKSIAFPVDANVVDSVIEALKKVSEGIEAAPKAEAEAEPVADEEASEAEVSEDEKAE
ncbi:MAG: hypothetical protein KAH93_00905 [Candidatus Aenigmarchaeota archaeon]|nr:hypothetical protein [Candidatus Aenigmarchaeota archaeon]